MAANRNREEVASGDRLFRLVFDNLGAPKWKAKRGCVVPFGMTQSRGGGRKLITLNL
jgi:hypothetical protein